MKRVRNLSVFALLFASILATYCGSVLYAACSTGCAEAFFFKDNNSDYWKVTRSDFEADECYRTYRAEAVLTALGGTAGDGYKKELLGSAGCSGACAPNATTEGWLEGCTSSTMGSEIKITCHPYCDE